MRSVARIQISEYKEMFKRKALKAISQPMRLMPHWMDTIGAGVLISAMMDKNPVFKEKIAQLDGKVFLFEASDIKKNFYLHINCNDIKLLPHYAGKPDVTMKGETEVLFGLLSGKEDPDTVFFSRRLEIGGDTAAAILFKNILNSL
ncbi:MAG: SCP2 sterol-binding domain-containing protein [Thermodesulfobacteriota bacterium]